MPRRRSGPRGPASRAGALLLTGSAMAFGATPGAIDGSISTDGYTVTYGNGELTQSSLGLDLDLVGSQLLQRDLTIDVHGRIRELFEGDDLVDPPVSAHRIDTLALGWVPSEGPYVIGGRSFVDEVGQAAVDGIEIGWRSDHLRLGAFGGLEPNPYDLSFDGDFQTAGGYLAIGPGTAWQIAAGYVLSRFDGALDRQSATVDARFLPSPEFALLAGSRVDFGGEAGTRLGSARLLADWRPDRSFSIGLRYDLYRYLLREASLGEALTDSVEDLLRQNFEGTIRYRFGRHGYVSGRAAYRRRSAQSGFEVRLLDEAGAPELGTVGEVYVDAAGREYVLVAETVDEDAIGASAAIGASQMGAIPIGWRLGYTIATGFGRNDHEVACDLDLGLTQSTDLDLGFGVVLRDSDLAGTDTGGFVQAALFQRIGRDAFALLSYEGVLSDGDLDHGIYFRLGYRIRGWSLP